MLNKILMSCLLLLSFTAYADNSIKPLQVGSALPSIELNTQHDKAVKVGNDVKTILFAVDKAPSGLINNFLIKKDAGFLVSKKAYFVADISGMPSLITKMFAIPKMKKRAYDILLAKNATKVSFIPRKKGLVTVLKLAGGRVTSVDFVNNIDQLAKAIN